MKTKERLMFIRRDEIRLGFFQSCVGSGKCTGLQLKGGEINIYNKAGKKDGETDDYHR